MFDEIGMSIILVRLGMTAQPRRGGAVVILRRVAVLTYSAGDDLVILVIIEAPSLYSETARCSFSSSHLGSHLASSWPLRCQMGCGLREPTRSDRKHIFRPHVSGSAGIARSWRQQFRRPNHNIQHQVSSF